MKKLLVGISALAAVSAQANQPTIAELQAQIDVLAAAIEQQQETRTASKTVLGGYGEHHYNRLDGKTDAIDAHRYVLYVSHEYSDTVRFFSEFELEHSLAGNGDDKPGEVELEQAFVEIDLNDSMRVKTGLFLLPIGFLNETHEPDAFYGVERNSVEKNIIPTTWWETGAMLSGELNDMLAYDVAIHSGLSSSTPGDDGKIRAARRKSAKAPAEDLAFTARIRFTPMTNLQMALSVQQQQDISNAGAQNMEATLISAQAAYQLSDFSMKALYAAWDVDNAAGGLEEQEGYFVEAAYKVTPKVGVFTRYSYWDNAAGNNTETETTQVDLGVNYWVVENVVLKADFQDQDKSGSLDGLNLGLGWSF